MIVGFVGALLVFLALFFLYRNQTARHKELLKNEFSSLSQEALKGVTENFLELAKSHLSREGERATGELKVQRTSIEKSIDAMREQLQRYEVLVRDFEKDRGAKYASIEQQIKSATRTTETLQHTTQKLSDMLANVKVRGQWGEKMAEDILSYSGLQKGLHYDKNTSFETNRDRPDYTFYLPGKHKLAMDVKFPFNNYLKMVNAVSDGDKLRYQKDFLSDVKARINEITKRDYMPSSEETLDYVILFIPNEQVYGFVNEIYDGIIDETLSKKIILCSPWTLYAVLRIVWQAWQNYHYSEGVREIILHINGFLTEFEKFRGKMDNVGVNLERAQRAFDEMTGARQRKLEKSIEKIREYGMGQGLISDSAVIETEVTPNVEQLEGGA